MRGLQADFLHFRGPLLVVVPSPGLLAVGFLPDVRHFMGQRRKNVLVRAADKGIGIQCQLVDDRLLKAAGVSLALPWLDALAPNLPMGRFSTPVNQQVSGGHQKHREHN